MKTDLKKSPLYRATATKFTEVDVPLTRYLAVDGHGDPNGSPEYFQAIEALYTTGYATKFAYRARTGDDFVVGPLEALWWSDDPADFVSRNKSNWNWTALIPLPDPVSDDDVAAGLAGAAAKKPDLPAPRLLELTEGRSLQILHIGAYDDEGPTLARLHHEVMPEIGVTFNGHHHEIYLSDPRRTAPEKLKTILRQPVH